MRALILASCLGLTTSISAELIDSKQQRSLYAYSESQGLSGQVRCLYDIIALRDGSQLCGTFEQLSPLSYSFGSLSLNVDQVCLLSFFPDNPKKMHVLTTDSHTYIGNIPNERITFTEHIPSGMQSHHSKEINLPIASIQFIFLKPRSQSSNVPSDSVFHLTLLNGDVIPVHIADPTIELTDGLNHRTISSKDIVDMSFNGGLYGRLKNKDGQEEELPLTFVKKPYLRVVLPSQRETLKLPWTQVANIQSDMPGRNSESPSFVYDKGSYRRAGVSYTNEKKEKQRSMLETSGLSIVVGEPPQEKQEPRPLFGSNTYFDIPTDIVFIGEPEPLLAVEGVDSESFLFEDLLVLGEDFDLEECETESSKTRGEEKGATQESEDFEFISQVVDEKEPFLSFATNEQETEDIAYHHENFIATDVKIMLPESELDESFQEPDMEVEEESHTDLEGIIPQKTITNVPHQLSNGSSSKQGTCLEMVYVASEDYHRSGFYIKPHKVTNREYFQFVKAINYKVPSHWNNGKIPRGLEDLPVVNVSYKDAFLYAVWIGKRLPSNEEISTAAKDSEVLVDFGDAFYEWTSMPSAGEGPLPRDRATKATHLEESFFAAHFIVGSEKILSMPNDEYNNHTGFRIAADAH